MNPPQTQDSQEDSESSKKISSKDVSQSSFKILSAVKVVQCRSIFFNYNWGSLNDTEANLFPLIENSYFANEQN